MKFLHTGQPPSICFRHWGLQGEPRRVIVMRVTYDIAPDGALVLASPQPKVNFREESFGDIVGSPPKRESDIAPEKPRTDLIVNANAYAPGGRPSARFDVALAVREADLARATRGMLLHERRLTVTGPREWQYRGGIARGVRALAEVASLSVLRAQEWSLSDPEPALEVPLRYDHAYGGTVRLDDEANAPHDPPLILAHAENPVGRGYLPDAQRLKERYGLDDSQVSSARADWSERTNRIAAPQIELPGRPLKSIHEPYPLTGWGVVAKHWGDRYKHAGTFDEAWRDERHPLLPRDFDSRYWNGAHPDLQLDHLPADCVIELRGLVPSSRVADQTLRLHLPGLEPVAHICDSLDEGPAVLPLRMDTVIVDLLENQLTLLYRLSLPDTPTLVYIHVDVDLKETS